MTCDVIPSYRKLLFAAALSGAVLVLPGQHLAAQAVVQPVPPPELGDLQAALAILADKPDDLDALVRAGKASIALDDVQAALGFYRRAQSLSPGNGEVEAGLATVTLRQGNAVEAVKLYRQAERDGMNPASHAGDHGLALDLVGDNVNAQRFYREALKQGNDPEIVRRLALSQAISGDQRGSETTLLPLLQRSDLAAYRTRAFALAILGKSDEAVSIAETMLPDRLSNRMAPYLRYMPRLTRAQQAAAANLGKFPPANEIGRDSPEIAAYSARSTPQQLAANSPGARLEPSGEPLGGKRTDRRDKRDQKSRKTPNSNGMLIGERVSATTTPLPQPSAPKGERPQAQPVMVAKAEPEAEPVRTSQPAAAPSEPPRPSLSISASGETQNASSPESVSANRPLEEAFAAFAEPPPATVRPKKGAVDITKIDPPREKPAPPPKPKPPADPKRYWVQVATGRDVKALGFDWRRIKRKGGDLLKSSDGFVVDWGRTNRLVTGPYDSEADAQKAVTALKGKGLGTFAFTSAEGEKVRPLK